VSNGVLASPAFLPSVAPVRFEMVDTVQAVPADRAWRLIEKMLGGRAIEDRLPMAYTGRLPASFRPVATGVVLPAAAIAARFAGLPLDDYRARMRPEVFDVFVRHLGLIHGDETLDVVRAADLADD
jgi:hypothetical protein